MNIFFGFKIDRNELINSKYLLKIILTLNIEAVFLPFIYISKLTQEIKINIMLNLKIRNNELVKELKSVHIWRYYVGKSVSNKSGKIIINNIYSVQLNF